jgi:hypothetical protein
VEKSILHVKLVDCLVVGQGEGEYCADGGRLHNRAESPIEVDAGPLSETSKNPPSLVALESSISMKLVLEDPLAGDDVGAGRARNEVPGVVVQESSVFGFHSLVSIWISESATECPRHWRQRSGLVDGREVQADLACVIILWLLTIGGIGTASLGRHSADAEGRSSTTCHRHV